VLAGGRTSPPKSPTVPPPPRPVHPRGPLPDCRTCVAQSGLGGPAKQMNAYRPMFRQPKLPLSSKTAQIRTSGSARSLATVLRVQQSNSQ
jgi:hypothetical protein